MEGKYLSGYQQDVLVPDGSPLEFAKVIVLDGGMLRYSGRMGSHDKFVCQCIKSVDVLVCVRAFASVVYACICICFPVSLFPCLFVSLFVCLFVCVCVCVCVCVYVILRACNVRDVSVLVLIRTFQWILSSCMFLSFFWFILTSLLIQINLA